MGEKGQKRNCINSFFILFHIEVSLTNNVVLVSGVWQSDLVIYIYTHIYIHRYKEMATHSGVLAWRIPGTGEPGGLPSLGSHRVGHD